MNIVWSNESSIESELKRFELNCIEKSTKPRLPTLNDSQVMPMFDIVDSTKLGVML